MGESSKRKHSEKKSKKSKKSKKVKLEGVVDFTQDENTDIKVTKSKKEKTKESASEKSKPEENANEKKQGIKYTVSIAIPGSIIDNAQSPELRAYLAGQIARAAAVFCIDEIVIFRDVASSEQNISGVFQGGKKQTDPAVFLVRNLQYLETPQYLRKALFPIHNDLRHAGILNPIDSPHHMRIDEICEYREGLTLKRPVKAGKGSLVDCGMRKEVQIDKLLQPGVRVTVNLDKGGECTKKVRGTVVAPSTPREETGIYWGYKVRMAKAFTDVFTESPYPEGYDLTIGTSERGEAHTHWEMPKFKHCIIVLGGLHGLEAVVDSDNTLEGIGDPKELFDHYLNTCLEQGSRTIRTEEALLITMSALSHKIKNSGMNI